MTNTWFTSDLHFGHDREFIWGPRGYKDVEEMNRIQLEKFNSVVKPEDTVYILGDCMLGDNEIGEEFFKQLNGEIIIILGNHDTNSRIEIYKKYAKEVVYAKRIKLKKKTFYLSHFPTITANPGDDPGHCTYNLYGHTHQQTKFYEDRPYMYHVGVDSHNGYPVSIDTIISDIKEKIDECVEFM